eukprot:4140787-Pyramimonas_sp.AAC.1
MLLFLQLQQALLVGARKLSLLEDCDETNDVIECVLFKQDAPGPAPPDRSALPVGPDAVNLQLPAANLRTSAPQLNPTIPTAPPPDHSAPRYYPVPEAEPRPS